MPMLRLFGGRFAFARRSSTVWPPSEIRPSSGVSNPARQRRVVVLPQPLGPSRTTNSPEAISSDRSSTAVAGGLPANRLVRPSMRTWDMKASLPEQRLPFFLVRRDGVRRELRRILQPHLVVRDQRAWHV